MSLFTISDLHLSLGTNKPMDVFGGVWDGYLEKLEANWNSIVGEDDCVVIPGDVSWATYLPDALADFKFLDALKGEKILLKGNHDYWFDTQNKFKIFLEENKLTSIRLLHNGFMEYKGIALCGTKGCDVSKKPQKSQDIKIENREASRLLASLTAANEAGFSEKIVFLHYPPVVIRGRYNDNPIMEILKDHGIKNCYYGHLHYQAVKTAICGKYNGIDFKLVSCDCLNFIPHKIDEKILDI